MTLLAIWTFIGANIEAFANWWSVAEAGRALVVLAFTPLFWPIGALWRRRQKRLREARDTGRHKETHDKLDETRETLNEIVERLREDSTDADAPDPTEALKTLQAYDRERADRAFKVIEEDPSLADSLFEELLSEAENRIDKDRKQASRYSAQRGSLASYSDTNKALMAYAKATELDPDNAEAWNQLGHLQRRIGNLTTAEGAYDRVLSLGNRSHDKELEAVALGNLGNIAATRGEFGAAEDFYNRAIALDEELGRREGMANNLGNLGAVALARRDLEAAGNFYNRAIALNEELGRKEGMADNLVNLGTIAQMHGDLNAAEDYQTRAHALNEELGRREGIAATLGNLGVIAMICGDLDAAEDFQTRALALSEELGWKEVIANSLGNLGSVAEKRGELQKARELWSQAHDLFAEIGMSHMVEKTQALMVVLGNKDSD